MTSAKAKGGIARAEKLSKERRSEIAKAAAEARWALPKATHKGELQIGDIRIPCAVLENGTRVITENGMTNAILRNRTGAGIRAKQASDGRSPLPMFLAPKRLKPFIPNEILDEPLRPIEFADNTRKAIGYRASLLPSICEVWLKARDAGVLLPQQEERARRAEMLMRGLAQVGIIALVDEATGYQEVRDRLALHAILDKVIRKELADWTKRFPDEFYKQIFRLRGWEWKGMRVNRPQVVAKYTNDIVYDRLAPGVLEELELKNPKDENGTRKARHHQWLTDDVGHPALTRHIDIATNLMKASDSWESFKIMLDRIFPKQGNTLSIDF